MDCPFAMRVLKKGQMDRPFAMRILKQGQMDCPCANWRLVCWQRDCPFRLFETRMGSGAALLRDGVWSLGNVGCPFRLLNRVGGSWVAGRGCVCSRRPQKLLAFAPRSERDSPPCGALAGHENTCCSEVAILPVDSQERTGAK